MENLICMCALCKRCTWKGQCGQEEPCCYFEPIEMEEYIEGQYEDTLKRRQKIFAADATEQGNFFEEEYQSGERYI